MAMYPDGTLLKASGPEIDRMEGGQRRWIPDPPTFNCMGLNWGAVKTISDSEWSQIPKGAPYPSRADGTLLQGSGPQVYVMTACQRHWIPDPDTFNALGYNWSAIQRVADADLTAIPEGAQLPSKVQQPTIPNLAPQLAQLQQQQDQLSQQIAALMQQIQQSQLQAQQPMSADQAQQLMSQQQQQTEMISNVMSQINQTQQAIISKM
jgi:hypothetical protein